LLKAGEKKVMVKAKQPVAPTAPAPAPVAPVAPPPAAPATS
jgi:large subunit ribosomal protein L17